MCFARAKIRELQKGLYLIDDAGASTCYLVCGTEKALLIDSVNGLENLASVVRSLTDLPVTVVNTHGHCDHIYGNMFFDEAWLHPADNELAAAHFDMFREEMDRQGRRPCPFRALSVGQVFDLGGTALEVVSLRGHTPGSVGLLDRARRLLFSGDGVNDHLWMQLDDSLPIPELKEMLLALKRDFGGDFDRVLTGHAKDYMDAQIVDILLRACSELMAGETAQDAPYQYFGGQCRQHPLSDVPGQCIVYWPDRL